jgi:hypothetical protein
MPLSVPEQESKSILVVADPKTYLNCDDDPGRCVLFRAANDELSQTQTRSGTPLLSYNSVAAGTRWASCWHVPLGHFRTSSESPDDTNAYFFGLLVAGLLGMCGIVASLWKFWPRAAKTS